MDSESKEMAYTEVRARIESLCEGDADWIAVLSTVACELHHSFAYFHWTGFYRVTEPELMRVGPYQGGHGCLEIPFHRGVCGAAATTKTTQLVEDVNTFAGHIACSSTTISEIVVPVLRDGRVLAVLDVDSDDPAAFDAVDQRHLESLCAWIASRYAGA